MIKWQTVDQRQSLLFKILHVRTFCLYRSAGCWNCRIISLPWMLFCHTIMAINCWLIEYTVWRHKKKMRWLILRTGAQFRNFPLWIWLWAAQFQTEQILTLCKTLIIPIGITLRLLVWFNKNWSMALLSLVSGFPVLFTKCFLGFGMNLMVVFDGEWG